MSAGLPRFAPSRPSSAARRWLCSIEVALASWALLAHVWLLNKIPMGFYTDEVSIGYNAYLIGRTGHDEFGVAWPLYTRSVGDYKNPFYVYLEVLVMRIVGCSAWTLRLPSVLCWVVGTGLLYLLARRLWSAPESRISLLLTLAFTPSLFCLSRIAFEVISLYPLLALFLFAVHQGFERNSLRWAAVAGVAIGLCTYAYTTFRFLAPLHCLLVVFCYGRRLFWRRLLAFGAAAVATVSPFGWYLHAHGDRLTSRYQSVGFVDKPMPSIDKLKLFGQHYVGYFDADYLLRQGDLNARHHTGYGGELFLPTVLGLLLAGVLFVFSRRQRNLRFNRLLLGGLLLSPVAAALTNDEHHSLRAFSLVVFAALLSVGAFNFALRGRARPVFALVALATALSGALFVNDYFAVYSTATIRAFEYYGFGQAIEKALRLHATRVVIENGRKSRHVDLHANFTGLLLAKRWSSLPPLVAGRLREVQPGEFYMFQDLKNEFPDLHEGLPEGSFYVVAPFGRVPPPPPKRKR